MANRRSGSKRAASTSMAIHRPLLAGSDNAFHADMLSKSIKRPNQIKLTLSDEEKQCLDFLRLSMGLTSSTFLRQLIRNAFHQYQLYRPNGTKRAAHRSR